jgi:hypothetical protein
MIQPGSHTAGVPTIPNGKPRFETRVIGLQVTRKTSWLTPQHRDFSKYEEWSKRVVDGARSWFETKTTDESGPPWCAGACHARDLSKPHNHSRPDAAEYFIARAVAWRAWTQNLGGEAGNRVVGDIVAAGYLPH